MGERMELSLLENVALDRAIEGGNATIFEKTIYFCPVPKAELQEYLRHLPLDHTSDAYHTLQMRKRGQLSQIYNSLAGLMFSVMHADSLRTMRTSRTILNAKEGIDTALLAKLNGLGELEEALQERLFDIPIRADAAKAYSDIVQEYNGIVQEHHHKTFRMSGDKALELDCSYGARYGGQIHTFEALVDRLGWKINGASFDDFQADRLHLNLTTAGIGFIMKSRPLTNRSICEAYGVSYGTAIPDPLEPAQINVSSRRSQTIYAEMLTQIYDNVLTRFEHDEVNLHNPVDLPYSNIALCYCPKPVLQEGKEWEIDI